MRNVSNAKPCWLLQFGLALALGLPMAGYCADDLLTSQMVDEARVWQSKGRNDLAANVWQRILVTNPQHGEALTSLGMIAARSGNLKQAQAIYQRAKRLQKPPANLLRLAAMLESRADQGRSEQTPIGDGMRPVRPPPVAPRQNSDNRMSATPPASTVANETSKIARPKKNALPIDAGVPNASMRTAGKPLVPVPPPSSEVTVTPLPFATVTPKPNAPEASAQDGEGVNLRSTEAIHRPSASPHSAPTQSRRPKPCRVPLSTSSIPPSN